MFPLIDVVGPLSALSTSTPSTSVTVGPFNSPPLTGGSHQHHIGAASHLTSPVTQSDLHRHHSAPHVNIHSEASHPATSVMPSSLPDPTVTATPAPSSTHVDIALFFANPLVHRERSLSGQPFISVDGLAQAQEQQLLLHSVQESNRAVRLRRYPGTTDSFGLLVNHGCTVLHFSGKMLLVSATHVYTKRKLGVLPTGILLQAYRTSFGVVYAVIQDTE